VSTTTSATIHASTANITTIITTTITTTTTIITTNATTTTTKLMLVIGGREHSQFDLGIAKNLVGLRCGFTRARWAVWNTASSERNAAIRNGERCAGKSR
jgi:hypothetical protein